MDVYNKKTRSYVMSRIRSRDTKAELLLRRLLCSQGLRRYRLHTDAPGRPDICFKAHKIAIFVDGCFWHGCPYCAIAMPISNRIYWKAKLLMNKARDKRNNSELRALGWTPVRFWEHQVLRNPEMCLRKLSRVLKAVSV
jgi:DNA mismatch endonuclease, patch repair protein